MSLRFIAISGTTAVTENLYVYEYDNDMIIVDCGVGFPETEMYGVDLVIPDFTYVLENKSKLRGILISHGHEDHIGALPFLLKQVQAPIYATKLVAGFLEDKFLDYKVPVPRINVFDPMRDTIALGVFKINPFGVSHSVPDGVGYAIDTPEGKVFHVADYKFDWTPVSGEPFDVAKAASLASGGVLMLASDCLGSTTAGYTVSESKIESKIEGIVGGTRGKVLFTTISSNVSRIQQALNVSQKTGRKVIFIGRSIEKKTEIAKRLGFLYYDTNLVISPKRASSLPQARLMYIIAGSYGQIGSSLYRVATGEHNLLSIKQGDAVIFSSDPAPPGTKENVDYVVDRLFELGADVSYYDIQEDMHVSGHGSQEDIKMLFGLTKPKYFVPIGGTVRHMRAFSLLAQSMGAKQNQVFELKTGEVIEFKEGLARIVGRVPSNPVLVDGLGVGDVGNIVLRDRQVLAKDGIAIILLQFNKQEGALMTDPEIISRGFVYEGGERDFLKESAKKLRHQIETKNKANAKRIRDITIDFLERYFYEKTGRRPMVLPVVVEV